MAAIKNREIYWPLTEQKRHSLTIIDWDVKIQWIKARVGIEGNELAKGAIANKKSNYQKVSKALE